MPFLVLLLFSGWGGGGGQLLQERICSPGANSFL